MIGAALAGPGVAQEQASQEEVQDIGPVVGVAERYVSKDGTSASKSDIPLVEMPQSVSVVSRDMIDLLNWTSLNESVRYSAGATGEAFGPDERYDWLQIRGFDPVQFIDGVQAPIGSVNNTGARSQFLNTTFARLVAAQRGSGYTELDLREALRRSEAVSADTNDGVNPLFPGTSDPTNAARLGNVTIANAGTSTNSNSPTNVKNANMNMNST
jgi:hypothetical protein